MSQNRNVTFTRSFGYPLLGVISAFLCIGISLLIWLTYAQDKLQLEQEKNLAGAAIESRVEFLRRNLGDYGVWNDAVEHMVLARDINWANTNLGPYLYGMQGYDYSFVIGPQDEIVYSSRQDRQIALNPDELFGRGYRDVLGRMRTARVGEDVREVIMTSVDNRPALLGIAAIIPSDAQVRLPAGKRASFIVFVNVMDDGLLQALSHNYRLANMRYVPGSSAYGVPLYAATGEFIGSIVWDSVKPGARLRLVVVPFSIAFVLCFILGLLVVLRKARRSFEQTQRAREDALSQRVQADAERTRQEELTHTINAMRIEKERLLADAGRVHEEAASARTVLMADIADRINGEVLAFVETLYEMVRDLGQKSGGLRQSAESTHASAADVQEASDAARARLADVVGATRALSQSLASVRAHTQVTDGSLEQAIGKAGVVARRIDEVGEAIGRIRAIAQTIADIASQTNLLALNATIEAARAGESGRGFAVVAGEVKALASHTAGLTQEVSRQLAEIAETKQRSIMAIEDLIGSLGPASEASETIGSSMVDQAKSLGQVDTRVAQLVEISEQIEAISGTTRAAARAGLDNVRQVSNIADDVSSHVNELLSKVAALTDELKTSESTAYAGRPVVIAAE